MNTLYIFAKGDVATQSPHGIVLERCLVKKILERYNNARMIAEHIDWNSITWQI